MPPGGPRRPRKPKRRRSIFAPVGDVLAEVSGYNEAQRRRRAALRGKPVRGEDPTGKRGARVIPRRPVTSSFGLGRVVSAGSGARAVSATVPPHAKTRTPPKPRSIAEPTVTEKARKKAKRSQQPSRRPGAARKRRQGSILAGPPPLTYGALPTPEALARAEYAPTLTGYDVEARRDALAAEERRRAVQGFTLALMRELGGLPAGVAGDYAAAARATEGVAGAAADELRGAGSEANARLQADLAAIGAPAEAAAQSAQLTEDVFGGGAGAQYYTEGAAPTGLLIGEGARQTAFARQLPGFAALSGQQNFRQALYEAEQERQDLGARRAATLREMGARVPYYKLQIESERVRRQEAAADLAMKERAQASTDAIVRARFGLQVQSEAARQAAARGRLANDRTRLRLQSIQADRSWNAMLRRLGISERRLRLDAAKAQVAYEQRGKRGGLTPYQVTQLGSEAADLAKEFYNGSYDADGEVLQEALATKPGGYQEAMSDLLSRGIPLTLAQRALNRWWQTPGRYGRPKVPFQLRRRKK